MGYARLTARFTTFKTVVLALVCVLLMGVASQACATELPSPVVNYLKSADPGVMIRFDGVITFSNGTVYLPVLPQDPQALKDIKTQPIVGSISSEKKQYDDLVQFNTNLFLIKIIRTNSGKLALAKVDPYPIALKEGLLPKDLLLPKALYIPAELKVILGDIPYDPEADAKQSPNPQKAAATVFKTKVAPDPVKSLTIEPHYRTPEQTSFYLTDLSRYRLVEMQVKTNPSSANNPNLPTVHVEQLEKISLKCLPRDIMNGPDSQSVWVTCLNTPEVVVIDRESNAIKTRIRLDEAIAHAHMLPNANIMAISHRSSHTVSWIDTKKLIKTGTSQLPGLGGAMAYNPITRMLYISDAATADIYEWSATEQKMIRKLHGLDDTSALFIIHQPGKQYYKQVLWAASRSKNYVLALNIDDGQPIKTFTVGNKPTDIAWTPANPDKLFVVCGAAGEVDVINPNTFQPNGSLKLPRGAFPLQILLTSEKTGLLSLAGEARLMAIDLKNLTTRFHVDIPFPSHRLIKVEGLNDSPLGAL